MPDQKFKVECGFFNSVDQDRLYTAEDMNRPYKRVITNGVFATPNGTPSTDFQVFSQDGGMNIVVKKGQGIFADKWFESTADLVITIPGNTNIVPRVDSVVIQVDNTMSGRCGNIVYREGSPNSNPVPPLIGQAVNVKEYRVANITVSPGASSIKQASIIDLRGSAECPWITGLIKQVDTSTLFEQYKDAQQQFYTNSTQKFNEWFDDTKSQADQIVESAHSATIDAKKATQEAQHATELAGKAAENANEAAEEVRALLPDKATTYVLQWTDEYYGDHPEIMEENKAVLEAIESAPVGSCHIVLQHGEKEYPLYKTEYGEEHEYFFAAPADYRKTPREYVVWYKPASGAEAAECGLRERITVNTTEMNKTNFMPPATALVSALLDSKVNKETDKGLSTNDYTTEERDKLAGISENANCYVHPAASSAGALGLYKVEVDGTGHISRRAAVTKEDITPLLDMEAILAALPDAMEVDY